MVCTSVAVVAGWMCLCGFSSSGHLGYVVFHYNDTHNQPTNHHTPTNRHPNTRRNRRPAKPKSLRIYEAHVGMSGEDERVSTYAEFRDNVLPRIKAQGYTAIQLMAIQVSTLGGGWGSALAGWLVTWVMLVGWCCWAGLVGTFQGLTAEGGGSLDQD